MVSWHCYFASTAISSRTQKWLNYIFTWLSFEIPRKPLTFIFIGISLSLSFSLGLLNLNIENRFSYLSIPRESVVWTQFMNVLNIFGDPPSLMSLLITTESNEYNNIISPSNMNETYNIFNILYNDENRINYKNEYYADFCYREYASSPICRSEINNIYGILFQNNITKWQNINNTLSIINAPSSSIEYYIGGIQYDDDYNNMIKGGNVLRLTYELNSDNDDSHSFQRVFDEYWSQHSNDYKNNPHSNISTIYHVTDRSLDDEINRVFIADGGIFASSFIGMLIFLTLLLGTFNCIGIRFWLSFSVILILICSLCIGFGFASMIGTDLSIIVMLVPYILIGVGVDDMIILVDTYNRCNYNLTETLQISGLSISLTSLCSFVAFLIASFAPNSPPSITTFCITASASFLALYLMQFLIFVPFMIYDQKRIERNGNFCCPCFKHKQQTDYNYKTKEGRKHDDACYFNAPWILQKTIVPMMKYKICRWIIIILFLSGLCLSLYFIPSVDRETDQSHMVPSDSFILEYQSIFESSFDAKLLTEVQIIIENEDFSHHQIRQNIYNLFDDLSKYPNYISISNWLQPFESWLIDKKQLNINNMTNKKFYDELQIFINITQYRLWEKEIFYGYNQKTNEQYIKATRFYLFAFKDESILSQYDDYMNYNDMIINNSLNGYMFEEDYGFAYLSHIIIDLTVENMLYCAFGVLLILLLLMDLRLAIFCFIIVIMIDVYFIGWMVIWNISLDPISYAGLVMAVGLTVDYIIHITHSIASAKPKNNNDYSERLCIAMNEMGGSVFKGALTTLLGGFPLIFSTSKGFVLFYTMICGIVICAVLHGIILTPALLAEFPWIYEKSDDDHDGDDDDHDDNVDQSIAKPGESLNDEKTIRMIQGDGENEYGSL